MINTRKLTLFSLLLAVSLILSYIESLIPLPLPIPGVKIGLANLASLISLWALGFIPALLLVITRVLLSGFLFGSMSSILYALAGGILSILVMAGLMHFNKNEKKWSLIFISICGAIAHNFGQVLVAACIIENINLILYYLPFLILLAIPAGLIIGILSNLMIKMLRNYFYSKQL